MSNIRELEGALNRIVAFASMGATPISIELAQAVLSNVLYNPKKRQVTPERIARAVSDYYSVPMDALQGQKRDKSIVMPRQIAMFLMREETDVSLLRIGAELGGRDHSTVLHACDKITREIGGQRRAAPRDRGGPRAHLRRLTGGSTGRQTGRPCDPFVWITTPESVENRTPLWTSGRSGADGPAASADGARRGRRRRRSSTPRITAGVPRHAPALHDAAPVGPPSRRARPRGGVHTAPHHDDGDDGVRR